MNVYVNDSIFKNYTGKKGLVTGGVGFVGSNLVRALFNLEADVTVLSDFFTGMADNVQGLPSYRFIHGNVCDEQLIR